MQFLNIFTTLALSACALAAPLAASLDVRAASNTQNMVCPSANGLAGPDAPQALQYILLGVGTQNYTCATPNSATVAPVANGAVAKLYDMTKISDDPNGNKTVAYVPQAALVSYYAGERMTEMLLRIARYEHYVGDHYFVAGTPTFSLDGFKKGEIFRGKKLQNVPAPANSFAGRGEGAVDWLKLIDNGSSSGVKSVFRVYTAGGKAPATCEKSAATFEVKYATEYWVYA